MKKSLFVLAVAVLALSACGGSNLVATVGATEIFESDVESLIAPEALESGVIPAEQFADELLNVILENVVVQAAEAEYGITFTETDIDAQREEFRVLIEEQGQTVEDFLTGRGATEDWLRRVAHQQLVYDAVEERLFADEGVITDDDIRAQYDSQIYDLTDACVGHILVATEEEAAGVVERLDGGEDFATVAAEVSTDGSSQNGGELGCGPLSQWVVEFAQGALDATIGEPTQPVQSQFGYHIILVTERTTTSFEDAEEDMRTQVETLRRGSLIQDWLLRVLDDADVSVVEEYGSWATTPFPQILPPQ